MSRKTKTSKTKADPPTISHVIRETIKRRGLTAYTIAKLAGVSVDPVQRFLNDERGLQLSTADRLANALGLRLIDTTQS